jgi:WXXGXW repeat (2 copies)
MYELNGALIGPAQICRRIKRLKVVSMTSSRETRSLAALIAIPALLVLVGAVWPFSATAQISLDVVIHTPPPPVRVEVVPAPRPGYVWAPGYWSWDSGRHIWHEGYWEAEA